MEKTLTSFKTDLKDRLLDGIKQLNNSVSSTLGPAGRTVLIKRLGQKTKITKDGVTVAKNFKGRPVGSGKNTFIEDPLLGDYKITIDEYSYNVFDTVKNKTVGFHTTLEQAIISIARKLMLQDKTYSLEEFATEFQQTHTNLKEAILK